MRNRLLLVAAALGAASCASTREGPPPGEGYSATKPMDLIEGPGVAPPANDIPESRRIAWLEAQRPRVAPAPQPTTRVERVYVREPARYVDEYRRWDDWYVPISLSLGWWGGGRRGRGWGWGIGIHDRWWW